MTSERSEPTQRAESFDSAAVDYDTFRLPYPTEVVQFVVSAGHLSEESRVLEVGCGTGQLSVDLARRACELVAVETPYLGKEDGVMPTERIPGKSSTRRYTPAEREQAVRLVRQLRGELGTDQGTVARVAKQLGYGVESVRAWVNQADIDGGVKDGTSTEDAMRIKELEQEVKELRRANEILKKASAYFAQAELDRPPR